MVQYPVPHDTVYLVYKIGILLRHYREFFFCFNSGLEIVRQPAEPDAAGTLVKKNYLLFAAHHHFSVMLVFFVKEVCGNSGFGQAAVRQHVDLYHILVDTQIFHPLRQSVQAVLVEFHGPFFPVGLVQFRVTIYHVLYLRPFSGSQGIIRFEKIPFGQFLLQVKHIEDDFTQLVAQTLQYYVFADYLVQFAEQPGIPLRTGNYERVRKIVYKRHVRFVHSQSPFTGYELPFPRVLGHLFVL